MQDQRTQVLASLTLPEGVVLPPQHDAAMVEFSLMPAIDVDQEPFFGGYMADDMLDDMGVRKADATSEETLQDEA